MNRPDSPAAAEPVADGPIVLELSLADAADLAKRLWLIEKQAINAATGSQPLNPDAVFALVDRIREDLTAADVTPMFAPQGRFGDVVARQEDESRREAARKLAARDGA